MEKSKENFDVSVIKSQNNQLEIEKESRRLEKLFYFYRDVEQRFDKDRLEIQIKDLHNKNKNLMDSVVECISDIDSKFLKRFDHLWNKFTVRKN